MFEHSTIVVRHDDGAYQAHGKVRDMAPHALFPRLIPLATLTELSLAPVSFVTTLGEGEVWDGDPDIPSGQLAASGSWEYGRPKRAMNEVEQLAELERLKDAKKASITARFRDLIAEGVTVDGEVIDLSPSGFTTLLQHAGRGSVCRTKRRSTRSWRRHERATRHSFNERRRCSTRSTR